MYIQIPPSISQTCTILKQNGFQAYIVGGAVRDSLLKLTPLDWDVATDALPNQVEQLFDKTIDTGKQFGTVSVILSKSRVEITTLRKDGPYSDGRHPEQVFFTDDLIQDLSRRDFTVNAMAYDPFEHRLIDPFRGASDLKRKRLITVGDPTKRFSEDPLRMLRLLRFQSTLNFKVEKKTGLAMEARWIESVSAERIQVELSKMLLGQNLASALQLFYTSGLMEIVIPDLAAGANVSAGDRHPYDLLGHSIMAAHYVYPSLALRWAALLHDLGKLQSLRRDHASIGTQMTKKILIQLRYANKFVEEVSELVYHHMFDIHPHSSDRAIRRFIATVGPKRAKQLIQLRQGDMAGMNANPLLIVDYGTQMTNRLTEVMELEGAFKISDLTIDGQILMNELDLIPGPLVGELLHHLLEQVLDDPKLNNQASLLDMARKYLASSQENAP